MEFLSTNELSESWKAQLLELWNKEYPTKIAYTSIQELENYLSGLKDPVHILMIDEKGAVRGWYFDFNRQGERWFAIIVDSAVQGKGFGSELLNRAKAKEPELNAWVIDHDNDVKQNGEVYRSPLQFYMNNGFELLHLTRLELEHLSAVKIRWKRP